MILLIRVILIVLLLRPSTRKLGASIRGCPKSLLKSSEQRKGEERNQKFRFFTDIHYRHSQSKTIFGFPFALQILFMLQKKLTMIIGINCFHSNTYLYGQHIILISKRTRHHYTLWKSDCVNFNFYFIFCSVVCDWVVDAVVFVYLLNI